MPPFAKQKEINYAAIIDPSDSILFRILPIAVHMVAHLIYACHKSYFRLFFFYKKK